MVLPLFGPGLWEPPELQMAEYARRIGLNLLGADQLSVESAVNQVPIRRELGRGELPFLSSALAFEVFGLFDWAGRLAMAAWALVGMTATYALVVRFADRTLAVLSVLVLSLTPLYFVHARSMLGDAATMAAVALSFAGLGVALLDTDAPPRQRVGWLCLGLLGLYAGFWCRGLLIGVAMPLTGVLLADLACALQSPRRKLAAWIPSGALGVAAAVSLVIGLGALWRAEQGADYSILVGAASSHAVVPASHDAVLQHLGHALFPVSALLPFAFARLFRPPAAAPRARRELKLRLLMLSALISAFAMHSLLAPFAGVLPFSACFACAVAVALMLRDLGSPGEASRVLGMAVAATAVVLAFDFRARPDTAFAAYALFDADFPESLRALHQRVWLGGTLLFALLFFLGTLEAPPARSRRAWWQDYQGYLRALRTLWNGNLWFSITSLGVALATWALLLVLSDHLLHLAVFEGMWSVTRTAAQHAFWVFPALVFVTPLAVFAARDLARWWMDAPGSSGASFRLRSRAGLLTLALAGFCAVLSLSYYPSLARQLSVKDVFQRHAELSRAAEPLGLVGVNPSTAAYYGSARVHWLETPGAAARWLAEAEGRRFLVLRASDLPALNSRFRARSAPRMNLPVIDARSSEVLLASNRLDGARNENPCEGWLLHERPALEHPLDANLGDRLNVLGWEIRDAHGVATRSLNAGRLYELRLVYQVIGRIADDWDSFVHIDGHGRRFNADHTTLQGRYSLALLLVGDVIVDAHTFALDPNFTPGDYTLYFGLYRGERRMPVVRGRHDDDRLNGGVVRVR